MKCNNCDNIIKHGEYMINVIPYKKSNNFFGLFKQLFTTNEGFVCAKCFKKGIDCKKFKTKIK